MPKLNMKEIDAKKLSNRTEDAWRLSKISMQI